MAPNTTRPTNDATKKVVHDLRPVRYAIMMHATKRADGMKRPSWRMSGSEPMASDDRGRFGPPAHNRRRPDAGKHVGQPALSFRVAQERRCADACLKNDDGEAARRQLVDERRRFGHARDFADRGCNHGRAAHAPHQLGQLLAEARLEQSDAGTM